MKILVIGGTQFVGRLIVTTLLADGDDVTLFHRGATNPGLFPDADHRLGDRNNDLNALATGTWDATIDTSAYVPRQVRSLAEVLGGRGGRFVHISSVSAYAEPLVPGFDEDAPLAVLDDPAAEVVNACQRVRRADHALQRPRCPSGHVRCHQPSNAQPGGHYPPNHPARKRRACPA